MGGSVISNANDGERVILAAGGGSLCEGRTVDFRVYKDLRFRADELVDGTITNFAEGEAAGFWDAVYDGSIFLRGYYFKAVIDDSELRSSTLNVKAPVVCSTSSLSLKKRVVGTVIMPNWSASA